jgi:hypothetical protein
VQPAEPVAAKTGRDRPVPIGRVDRDRQAIGRRPGQRFQRAHMLAQIALVD